MSYSKLLTFEEYLVDSKIDLEEYNKITTAEKLQWRESFNKYCALSAQLTSFATQISHPPPPDWLSSLCFCRWSSDFGSSESNILGKIKLLAQSTSSSTCSNTPCTNITTVPWLTGNCTHLVELGRFYKYYDEIRTAVRSGTSSITNPRTFTIEGRSGIGKSCFLAWLIYKIFSDAAAYRLKNHGYESDTTIPSFVHSPKILYIWRVGSKCWLLELNQEPVMCSVGENCDYVISDDVDIHSLDNRAVCYVAASSDNETLKEFTKRRIEESGTSYCFTSLTFTECKRVLVETALLDLPTLRDRFAIVGGKPRFLLAKSQRSEQVPDVYDLLEEAVKEAFDIILLGTKPSQELLDWTMTLMTDAWKSAKPQSGGNISKILSFKSLFTEDPPKERTSPISKEEKEVEEGKMEGIGNQEKKVETAAAENVPSTCDDFHSKDAPPRRKTTPASRFMGVLLDILLEKNNTTLRSVLENVLTGGGYGHLVEFVAHKAIVGGRREWYAISLNSAEQTTIVTLPFAKLTLFHIHCLADLMRLPEYCYGLPSFSFFPIIDAVIRIGSLFILLQMTTARSHPPASKQLVKKIMSLCRRACRNKASSASAAAVTVVENVTEEEIPTDDTTVEEPDENEEKATFEFVWVLADKNFAAFNADRMIAQMNIRQFKTRDEFTPEEELVRQAEIPNKQARQRGKKRGVETDEEVATKKTKKQSIEGIDSMDKEAVEKFVRDNDFQADKFYAEDLKQLSIKLYPRQQKAISSWKLQQLINKLKEFAGK